MIPAFDIPPLFGLIHAFGVLVATGILVGARGVIHRGKQLRLEAYDLNSAISWVVITGFVISHFFDVVAYQWHDLMRNPWAVLDPRTGLSSFGGFLGGVVGLFLWRRRKPIPILHIVDALCVGLVFGWFFGRLGCFTAHDHRGRLTSFFLAVAFPDGARHDLGLYEAIFTLGLSIAFLVALRRNVRPGWYITLTCITYPPVRFGLDFLRATDILGADPRYFGLTPGQYGSIVLLVVGLALAWRIRRAAPQAPAAEAAPGDEPAATDPPREKAGKP